MASTRMSVPEDESIILVLDPDGIIEGIDGKTYSRWSVDRQLFVDIDPTTENDCS